jgi:small subunit ribosomal protein S1
MVDRNLIASLELEDDIAQQMVAEALGADVAQGDMETLLEGTISDFKPGRRPRRRAPVMRKIKGGLLVDIGVPVFLPASQVDIRRPHDIGDFIGRSIAPRSSRSTPSAATSSSRAASSSRTSASAKRKKRLLEKIEEGDLVTGTVKNIADFGAFVDLGGIDGLLHITDMSWGRVNHPSEMVKIDQKIEVKILNIDYDKEKIALGLKQKEASPWEEIEQKYPVGRASRARSSTSCPTARS